MIRSRFRILAILVLSAAACAALGRVAAAQAPSNIDIDRWIAELGDDSYSVRKTAADNLAAGGFAARAALAKVADGTDPEVRSTARRLLAVIDDTEFNRRLSDFAADVDGRRGVTLPGWQEFGDLVGRDPAARALFVDMQREEAALLARSFADSRGSREIDWEAHVMHLLRARNFNQPGEFSVPLGSCATLVFLGALSDANVSDNGARSLVQLTQIPPLSESLAANRADNAVRRLVTAWIVHCPNRSETILDQRLQIMIQQQLADALPLALDVISRDPKNLTLSPSLQMTALLAVGKLGSEQHVAAIEPLLEDRSELRLGQPVNGLQGDAAAIQVRDVALAVLLHLTEQEPLTYGYLHVRPNPLTVFDVTTLGMENDQQRAAAAERWRAWRAQHKLDAPRPASS
jgi:hypothetical protein